VEDLLSVSSCTPRQQLLPGIICHPERSEGLFARSACLVNSFFPAQFVILNEVKDLLFAGSARLVNSFFPGTICHPERSEGPAVCRQRTPRQQLLPRHNLSS